MDPKLLVIFALTYLLGLPLVLRLLCVAHTKLFIQRAQEKAAKKKNKSVKIPEPLWPKIRERLSFSFKDNRPLQLGKKASGGPQNRIIFLSLWGAGLLCFVAAPLTGTWALLGLGALLFFVAIGFGIYTANSIIVTRQEIYQKMFQIAASKLGVRGEPHEAQRFVRILEWKDLVKPNKVEFDVPTTFGEEGAEGFLRQFNQVFGMETTWVPKSDPETGAGGWDFENGKVTLGAVPPLPMRAPWSEHYVLSKEIAWSFFPIALGVENGLELTNPNTGEVENVLGFDFSGEQKKVAEKMGVKMADRITTSPMVLVGGGTGGGKSLSVDTPVRVKKRNTNPS